MARDDTDYSALFRARRFSIGAKEGQTQRQPFQQVNPTNPAKPPQSAGSQSQQVQHSRPPGETSDGSSAQKLRSERSGSDAESPSLNALHSKLGDLSSLGQRSRHNAGGPVRQYSNSDTPRQQDQASIQKRTAERSAEPSDVAPSAPYTTRGRAFPSSESKLAQLQPKAVRVPEVDSINLDSFNFNDLNDEEVQLNSGDTPSLDDSTYTSSDTVLFDPGEPSKKRSRTGPHIKIETNSFQQLGSEFYLNACDAARHRDHLQEQVVDLRERLAASERKKAAEAAHLKAKAAQLVAAARTCEQRNASLTGELMADRAALTAARQQLIQESQQLKDLVAELKGDLGDNGPNSLLSVQEALQNIRRSSLEEIQRCHAQQTNLQQSLSTYKENHSQARFDLATAQEKVKDLENDCKLLRTQLDSKQHELEQLSLSLESLRGENRVLSVREDEAIVGKASIEKQLEKAEAQVKEGKEQVAERQDALAAAEAKLVAEQERLQATEQEMRRLHDQLAAAQAAAAEVPALRDELVEQAARHDEKLSDLSRSKHEMAQRLSDAQEGIKASLSSSEHAARLAETHLARVEELKLDCQRLREAEVAARQACTSVKLEMEVACTREKERAVIKEAELEQQLRDSQSAHAILKQELSAAEKHNESAQAEIGDLQRQMQEFRSSSAHATDDVQRLEDECSVLQSQVEALLSCEKGLRFELEQARSQGIATSQHCERLSHSLGQLRQENDELIAKNKALESGLAANDATVADRYACEALSETERKLCELVQRDMNAEHERELRKRAAEKAALETQCTDLTKKVEQAQAELQKALEVPPPPATAPSRPAQKKKAPQRSKKPPARTLTLRQASNQATGSSAGSGLIEAGLAFLEQPANRLPPSQSDDDPIDPADSPLERPSSASASGNSLERAGSESPLTDCPTSEAENEPRRVRWRNPLSESSDEPAPELQRGSEPGAASRKPTRQSSQYGSRSTRRLGMSNRPAGTSSGKDREEENLIMSDSDDLSAGERLDEDVAPPSSGRVAASSTPAKKKKKTGRK